MHKGLLRVLIADDNQDAADSLAVLCRLWGYTTCVAYDGAEAVDLAVSFRPHVLLLDIRMPGLHGGKVAEQLRQRPDFETVTIIATSANESDDHRLQQWQHLFDDHLVKPYNLTLLEGILAERAECLS